MKTLRTLMTNLIDYAGLFPPAGLGMWDAVRNYAAYRARDEAWALGRFVVPVGRLAEFARASNDLPPGTDEGRVWRLAALGGANPKADVDVIAAFNRELADRGVGAIVDSYEAKARTGEEVQRICTAASVFKAVYVEVPLGESLELMIGEIARLGLQVKVRTGGVTPEQFPSPASLARFLTACCRCGVAFKATAGLHHPLRGVRRLTDEPDGATGWVHGFLNLFLAAVALQDGATEADAAALLEEEELRAFAFSDEAVKWRERRFSVEEVERTRREFAVSFGSCSFEEPFTDLHALGLLR